MTSRTNEQAKADATRRRAEALRANLKRRKAAARGVSRTGGDPQSDPSPANADED